MTQLHYELLLMFTQFIDNKDIYAIKETFQSLDDDNSGTIEIGELRECYLKINSELEQFNDFATIEDLNDD